MSFVSVFPTQGGYPITAAGAGSLGSLPNVTVAYPGEHWSNGVAASGVILPGEAVVPFSSGGKLSYKVARDGDHADPRMVIAKQPVSVPDLNPGSIYNEALGPNEIVNRPILIGDYVHVYRSGAFQLTLVVPGSYSPGDLIGWNPEGVRPDGKPGGSLYVGNALTLGADHTGCWDLASNCPSGASFFEAIEWRPYIASDSNAQPEGILTVKSLRTQM